MIRRFGVSSDKRELVPGHFTGGIMRTYRLIFRGPRNGRPFSSVTFVGDDPAEALLLAQRYESPAELWVEDQFLCTLQRTGDRGELWVISGRPAAEAAATDAAGLADDPGQGRESAISGHLPYRA